MRSCARPSFAVGVLLAFYYNDLYGGRAPRSVTDLSLRVIKSFLAAGLFLAIVYYMVPSLALGRGILLIHPPLALAMIIAWRFSYYWALQRESFVENVLILGTGNAAASLARELLQHRKEGYRLVGFLGQDPAEVGKSIVNPTVVGTFDDLLPATEKLNVHSVVVALEEQRGKLPLSDLLACKMKGIAVAQGADFYEAVTGQLPVRNLRPSSLIFAPGFRKPRFFHATRRGHRVLAGPRQHHHHPPRARGRGAPRLAHRRAAGHLQPGARWRARQALHALQASDHAARRRKRAARSGPPPTAIRGSPGSAGSFARRASTSSRSSTTSFGAT